VRPILIPEYGVCPRGTWIALDDGVSGVKELSTQLWVALIFGKADLIHCVYLDLVPILTTWAPSDVAQTPHPKPILRISFLFSFLFLVGNVRRISSRTSSS